MLYRDVCRLLGSFFCAFAFVVLCPLAVGLYYEYFVPAKLHPQPHANLAFLETIGICLALGLILSAIGRRASGHLHLREGLAAVVLIWLLIPVIGGLPFYLSNTLQNPIQAYFEGVASFTTTGSTVMEAKVYDPITRKEIPAIQTVAGVNPTTYKYYGTIAPVRDLKTGKILYEGTEAVGKGLLWWRCFMQWLGGLGIVVLFVAILPALGVGGKILLFAELPGPIKDSFTPRVTETATMLWKIYLGLTILAIAILCITNNSLDLYEAVTIAFATVSTGGTLTHADGLAYYHSYSTEWVVIAFMIAGSINFTLYYHILRGRIYRLYDPEFILYALLIIVGSIFVSYQLIGTPNTLLTGQTAGLFTTEEAIHSSIFHVVSAESSTGIVLSDYDKWPFTAQTWLLLATIIGGMSGSTAGGAKIVRVYMLFRIIIARIESMFRPQAVRTLRIGDKEVDHGVAFTVLCYFTTMVLIIGLGVFLLICDGVDPDTAFTFIVGMVNNAGLTFRAAGPTESCAFLSNFGCAIASLWMLLGRLEFFAILVVLMPAFWKKNS